MYCGYKHEASKIKCPTYGKTCLKCKEKDHFQSVCGQQTRPVQNYRRKPRKFNKKLHQVEESELDFSENYYDIIQTLTTELKKHIYATMNVGKTPIRF